VALDLAPVPPAVDAEQKPSVRDLVYRSDELCRPDRIALDDEARSGRHVHARGCHRRHGQRDERTRHVITLLAELPASRRGVLRVLGICECSGAQTDSKRRASVPTVLGGRLE
jgi:hypothetical protein